MVEGSTIPCYRGGHNCRWPACPLDCDGRPGFTPRQASEPKITLWKCRKHEDACNWPECDCSTVPWHEKPDLDSQNIDMLINVDMEILTQRVMIDMFYIEAKAHAQYWQEKAASWHRAFRRERDDTRNPRMTWDDAGTGSDCDDPLRLMTMYQAAAVGAYALGREYLFLLLDKEPPE